MGHDERNVRFTYESIDPLSASDYKGPGPYVVVVNSSGNDIAGTIDSHYYLGCGCRGGVEREFVAYEVIRNKE